MLAKKNISAPLLAICISLNSANLFAAEESISSIFPVWPFFAILFFILIFRKQLNCVPPLVLKDELLTDNSPKKTIAKPTKPEVVDTTTSVETKAHVINLKDDSQCQGITAKGTRCLRKNTLQDTYISIDGITYLLTTCAQHNNHQFKLYTDSIK